MQCLVVNVTDNETWDWGDGYMRLPDRRKPGYLHGTREAAEREAVRLACETGGEYAVFELAGIVSGNTLSDSDPVKGAGPCGARIPQWAPEGGGI